MATISHSHVVYATGMDVSSAVVRDGSPNGDNEDRLVPTAEATFEFLAWGSPPFLRSLRHDTFFVLFPFLISILDSVVVPQIYSTIFSLRSVPLATNSGREGERVAAGEGREGSGGEPAGGGDGDGTGAARDPPPRQWVPPPVPSIGFHPRRLDPSAPPSPCRPSRKPLASAPASSWPSLGAAVRQTSSPISFGDLTGRSQN